MCHEGRIQKVTSTQNITDLTKVTPGENDNALNGGHIFKKEREEKKKKKKVGDTQPFSNKKGWGRVEDSYDGDHIIAKGDLYEEGDTTKFM